jgi:uncharacterized delta-60 repeat protein
LKEGAIAIALFLAACASPRVAAVDVELSSAPSASARSVADVPSAWASLEPDRAFGDGGRVVLSNTPGDFELWDVLELPDGSVLAGGQMPVSSTATATGVVVKIDAHGQLDASFGNHGLASIAVSSFFFGRELAIDAKGRIVLAGFNSGGLVLARLTPVGAVDPTFGKNGVVEISFTNTDDRPAGVFALPTGGLLVAGSHFVMEKSSYVLFLARFDDKGNLEPTFGKGGFTLADPAPEKYFALKAFLDADGRVVFGGYLVNPADGAFVARMRADGGLDSSFGDGGITFVRAPRLLGMNALALDRNGRILLGGPAPRSADDLGFAVARFEGNGLLDPTWGDGGVATRLSSNKDGLFALVPAADGSVFSVGWRRAGGDAVPAIIARADDHGAPDRRFGKDGAFVLPVVPDVARAALLDASGALVIVGNTSLPTTPEAGLVARFLPIATSP